MTTKKKTASRAGTSTKKKTTKVEAASSQTLETPVAVTVTMAPAEPTTTAPVEPTAATPAESSSEATPAPEKPVLTIGMFQKKLAEHGYYDGAWDGHYGPYTKLWVARFQAAHSLPVDGEPTPATLAALGLQ